MLETTEEDQLYVTYYSVYPTSECVKQNYG